MFARLFAWLRRHQWLVDTLFMLPIAALSALIPPTYVDVSRYAGIPPFIGWQGHYALLIASCLPLIWRRRWPRVVFGIIMVVTSVQWLFGVSIALNNIVALVAMYTIAAERSFRWAVMAGAVVELGAIVGVYSVQQGRHQPQNLSQYYMPLMIVAAIWFGGLYINTRRKYMSSLEERARRLERERDAQAEVAAAAERARIAREMHDVVAHSISVMVVQADGAAWTVDNDAARAQRAMEAIGATGRQALMEMRRMLGVLREGGSTDLAPQPGVDQLGELVDQIRSAGLPLELTVGGTPMDLPAGLGLTIYRIVQEALTNVLKHAGPMATARVELYYGDQTIEVRVRDDGRGATFSDGRGHGLVGMRERAAVYGGTVRAEPAVGGGFQVIARLPVKEEARAVRT